jgi:hypothetical protein
VGELISAGQGAHERDLVEFASRVAAHAMSEIEILEPAALLVGDAVRWLRASSRRYRQGVIKLVANIFRPPGSWVALDRPVFLAR